MRPCDRLEVADWVADVVDELQVAPAEGVEGAEGLDTPFQEVGPLGGENHAGVAGQAGIDVAAVEHWPQAAARDLGRHAPQPVEEER